jgi:hypothetical protein
MDGMRTTTAENVQRYLGQGKAATRLAREARLALVVG